MQVFRILDHLRHTATGLDGLPAWFLRLGAPAFAALIAELFNQSLNTSTVPQQWKTAITTPIAKVTHPSLPSHYPPISITPVLSQVRERHIARTYIYPAILKPPRSYTSTTSSLSFQRDQPLQPSLPFFRPLPICLPICPPDSLGLQQSV
jgi:hypothetical protein